MAVVAAAAAAAAPAAHPLAVRAVRIYLLLSGLHLVLGGSLLPEAGGGLSPPKEDSEAVQWEQNAGTVAFNVTRAVVAQFTPANGTHRLTHLSLDSNTDDVYLGAVNRLYQLDGDTFYPLHQVVTGPRQDSPSCHASGCEPHVQKVPTDNYNKLLVVAQSVGRVIACGSVSQGACDTYHLGNISVHRNYIPKSVAANHPNASTFAFVGPERYHPWGGSEALYVGTTFTTVGDYRHDVPAISTRNLYDLDYAEFSYSKQSLLRIDVKLRDHFLVQYVYGFNATNYVYFLTVQKKSHLPGQEESGYVSRISRSCISDPNYDSYTEITLECQGGDSANYNLVQDAKLIRAGSDLAASMGMAKGDPLLVGVFAPSQGHTARPETASAVCVYSVHDIEAKFNENIHMCFNGSMLYRSMEYISGPILNGKCPQQGTMGNILSFCEVGLKISGPAPVVGRAALRLPRTLVTGLQATAAAAHTVAFLGTSTGTIKKILVASSEEAAEYEEVEVDSGFPILPDMRFRAIVDVSLKLTNLVWFLPWCTVQSACQKATFSSPRWLSFGSGQQCIDFEMILPDRLPIDQNDTIIRCVRKFDFDFYANLWEFRLTIRTLPERLVGAKYSVGLRPRVTPQIASRLTHHAWHAYTRHSHPRIHYDHLKSWCRWPSAQRDQQGLLFPAILVFYDCGCFTTPGSWVCGATGVTVRACPPDGARVRHSYLFWTDQSQLLAADRARSELQLKVENLPALHSSQLGFQCVVSIEGATMPGLRWWSDDEELKMYTVPSTPLPVSSYTRCAARGEPTVYRHESTEEMCHASPALPLHLVWRCLQVYRTAPPPSAACWRLGGRLAATHRPGPIGYHSQRCSTQPVPHAQDTDMIQPLAGPLEGGTLVTIEGSNLGLREEDVRGKTFIGEVPCHVHEYHVSVKITCRTGKAPLRGISAATQDLQFPVSVSTPAGTTTSTVKFTYTNVTVTDVWPRHGPVSGGTVLSISGRFLNVGSHVSATLDDLPCIVNKTQSSSHRLVCVTSRATASGDSSDEGDGPLRIVRKLTVTVDSAERYLASPFTYKPDPRVLELKPRRSPWSGGRMLTVHGTQLDAIQAPRITVLLQDRILNSSGCRVLGPDQMECPSPPVDRKALLALLRERRDAHDDDDDRRDAHDDDDDNPRAEARVSHKVSRSPRQNYGDSIALDVGFIMDNVASVRNLRHVLSSSARSLVYVLDPTYKEFPNSIKLYKGDTLVIEGENLNLASDESDVNVTIGTRQCNVTSLALTQLVCTPPEVQPPPTDELGHSTEHDLPLVVVRMGQNLRFPIGYLRYEMIKEYQFPPEAIGGMAAGGLFLVLVSMVILVVYRRKSNQAEREYKRIQIQMDTLESNVRSECKQAFAELQTDMTDLTADLESSGIPTLDHRSYVMKVFFPGVTDHPILNDPKLRMNGCRPAMDSAMIQFEQLITNRYFLLALIETLEAQKTFNIRDIVNVASLLVVAMAGRMEYLTEILRLLLLRLIDKSVATKHPQLMLRRTESVVEKMLTNWMTLCMYTYLKEQAGPSLFLLYKAIKHQVEKGPVDALTHDARYCLSEERLLREQITHSYV
ncbi:plexin-B-like, partial [Homarus americanus]|uniref:plexin-B-like n=1 Tax=Homarus americanus TaxID=6706 RepID=UPI001C45E523